MGSVVPVLMIMEDGAVAAHLGKAPGVRGEAAIAALAEVSAVVVAVLEAEAPREVGDSL